MIKRENYLAELISWKNKNVIKVITGVRRCGKSTLFKLYIDYLGEVEADTCNIISLNLEDLNYSHLYDYKELHSYISSKIIPSKINYIFIDEVQLCKDFERAVDSLYIQNNTDIYITGSNAYMLSGELATLLSGRYITIDMLPLSFKEYMTLENKLTVNQNFNNYIQSGSFPYVSQIVENEDMVKTYLDGIFNSILIKDIVKRESVTDIMLLESIIKTLASSIGSPISSSKIANTLVSNGRKVSASTIDKYLKCLVDSYLFYKVDRFDIKGREHLRTHGKYYIVDTGLRNLLTASSSKDIGHNIENIVFLELFRRGYKVNIGKLADKEVDFIATRGSDVLYIQVSASVLDENTLERELSVLQKIKDNHPKLLLTLDEIGAGSDYDGIKQENLINWLLSD